MENNRVLSSNQDNKHHLLAHSSTMLLAQHLLAQNMVNELFPFQVREPWFREVDHLPRVTHLISEMAGLRTQAV